MDLKFLASVYLALFVIMDPPGVIPVFLALTARRGAAAMARLALQAALTSFGVIVLFALLGDRRYQWLSSMSGHLGRLRGLRDSVGAATRSR